MKSKHLLLASAALAAAVLNIACWWFFTRQPAARMPHAVEPTPTRATARPEVEDPLAIAPTRIVQYDFTTNRIVSLAFSFNHAEDPDSFTPQTLRLFAGDEEIPWTRTGDQPRSGFAITTTAPVATNVVTVRIAPGIKSRIKDVADSATSYEFAVPVSNAFGLSRLETQCGAFSDPHVVVNFSKMPDLARLHEFVTCEPRVELSFSSSDSWYYSSEVKIMGDFQIGRLYKLTFRKDLPSSDGFAMEAPAVRAFTFPRREADVAFAVPGRYLQPEGGIVVPVKWVNTTNLDVSAARVLPQNIVQLMARENDRYERYSDSWYSRGRDPDDATELAEKPLTAALPVSAEVDAISQTPVRLADLIGRDRRGVFHVSVNCQDRYTGTWRSDRRLICVSDLALSSRVGKTTSHVWVTSLATGLPVADARVEIRSAANQLVGRATSGPDGIAVVPHAVADAEPFVVTAEAPDGADLVFMPLAGASAVAEKSSGTADYVPQGECTAFVFSDRGIYRHGEPIHARAILRNAETEAPAPFPVTFELVKPDGDVYRSLPLMPDALGALAPAVPVVVPEDQPSGRWRLVFRMPGDAGAVLGARDVTVEAFVPPQIRVSLAALPEGQAFDKPLGFRVEAEHLFGKPAGGLKAEASVAYSDAPFKPAGWEGYAFGDARRTVKDNFTVIGRGRLDDAGSGGFTLEPMNGLLPSGMLKATIEGTVFEPGGRPVSTRATVNLHRHPFYVGLRTPATAELVAGQTNAVAIALVAPDGKRLPGARALDVEILAVSHIYGLVREPNRGYVWKDETVMAPVTRRKVELPDGEDGVFDFVLGNGGDYVLVALDPAGTASSSFAFTVTEDGRAGMRSSLASPTKLDMAFDRDSYQAGDTARLRITAPFAGTALLSLQREEILESRVLMMTNATTVVEIPVTAAMHPSIRATASVIHPADAESSWTARRAAGVAVLKVARPEDKLEVVCTPSVEIVEGGSRIAAAIAIRGVEAGAPCHAAVFATDEAIHILTQEARPDPYAFFSAVRAAATSLYDLFGMLMPITEDALKADDAKIGGDDGSGDGGLMGRVSPVASRRFKPLSLAAAFTGVVGEDGVCTFDLPEFAGDVRLTAVAWTATASGSASANVKVAPKLVMKPDAPRFLACGDTAAFTLTLHNQSGADAEFAYATSFSGPLVGDPATATVALKDGESATIEVPVTAADEIGTGAAVFRCEGAGERHVETLEIPVRPAMPLATDVECIALKQGESVTLAPPADALPETVAQSLRFHNSFYAQFIPAIEFLLDYPFGCLEQTTSSAFPLIHAGGTLARFAVSDSCSAEEVEAKVNAAIMRVCSLKDYRGFSLWHDVGDYDNAVSVYACHFLAEADKAGHAVPRPVLDANATFLLRLANDAMNEKRYDLCAYACHVLALSGKPERPVMLTLHDLRDELPATGRAHLARAFAVAGDPVRALEVLEPVEEPGSIEACAFGILAWLEIDHPLRDERVARFFMRLESFKQTRGHWATTRDNAWSLLAAGAMARRFADAEAVLDLAVKNTDGTLLHSVTNANRVVKAGPGPLVVENRGRGSAYVLRTVSAIPSKLAFEPKANGIAVSRLYKNADGIVVDPSTLTRGDLVVVALEFQLDSHVAPLADAIVEELLPACLEPDVGSAAGSGTFPWMSNDEDRMILRREVRDDRLLFFLRPIPAGTHRIHYTARVVSKGEFTIPPAAIEGMYRPDIAALTVPGTMLIQGE